MANVKVGDEVVYQGRLGRVGATSGLDRQCIVQVYNNELKVTTKPTKWVSMDDVELAKE